MKTKGILIVLSLAIFTTFNMLAGGLADQAKNGPDSSQQRINIRVDKHNYVVLRAGCLGDQKWVNCALKVYSESGEMVYATSIIKKGGAFIAFDLSNFPEGKYTFEVHKKLKKVYSKEVFKSIETLASDAGNTRMIVQEL